MIKIFADSHKIVATNIYDNILNNYGVKLDKEKLLWGSIAPDILPKYRFIRHYQDESIDYIVRQITHVIFMSKYVDFTRSDDSLRIKILSREIGIISHYLSDFVCAPHANRWTFVGNMKKHIKYEKDLNEYARSHNFKTNIIDSNNIDLYDNQNVSLRKQIKGYIENVIEEYNVKQNFSADMDFASEINIKISFFILDTINAYSSELQKQFAFEI